MLNGIKTIAYTQVTRYAIFFIVIVAFSYLVFFLPAISNVHWQQGRFRCREQKHLSTVTQSVIVKVGADESQTSRQPLNCVIQGTHLKYIISHHILLPV